MGLDTTIKTDAKEELAYFRKDWILQQWWIDYARIHHRDLSNKWTGAKPIEETEGINREYYKELYEKGDYNCVDIPITIETWKQFLEETKEKHGWEQVSYYGDITRQIYGAITEGSKVYINGWW